MNLQQARFCSARFVLPSECPIVDASMYRARWDETNGYYVVYLLDALCHRKNQLYVAESEEVVDMGMDSEHVKESISTLIPQTPSTLDQPELSILDTESRISKVAAPKSWADIVEEDLEAEQSFEEEESTASSSTYCGSDCSEAPSPITPVMYSSSKFDLPFPRSEIKADSVSQLAFILLDCVVIKADIEKDRGVSCQKWYDSNKREMAFTSLDLLQEPWTNRTWTAWYLELPYLQPFNEVDGDDERVSRFGNCLENTSPPAFIYEGSDLDQETDQLEEPRLPNLAQYIPQDITEDFRKAWNHLLKESGDEEYCNSKCGYQHAVGWVRWFWMIHASQSIQKRGYGIRRALESADRSVDWFWTPITEKDQKKNDPRELERSQKVLDTPETGRTRERVHHMNFCDEPVYSKSATPPEVSLWAALSGSLKQFGKEDDSVTVRKWVLASEAGKLLDPFVYNGPAELLELNGQLLRDAVTGYVQKTYAPVGTWDTETYTFEEDVPLPQIALQHGWYDHSSKVTVAGKSGKINCPLPAYRIDRGDGDSNVNDDGRTHPVGLSKKRKVVETRSNLHLVQNIDTANVFFNDSGTADNVSEASTKISESVGRLSRVDDSQRHLLDEVPELSIEPEVPRNTSYVPPEYERLNSAEGPSQAEEVIHTHHETSPQSGEYENGKLLGAEKKDDGNAQIEFAPVGLSFQLPIRPKPDLQPTHSRTFSNKKNQQSDNNPTKPEAAVPQASFKLPFRPRPNSKPTCSRDLDDKKNGGVVQAGSAPAGFSFELPIRPRPELKPASTGTLGKETNSGVLKAEFASAEFSFELPIRPRPDIKPTSSRALSNKKTSSLDNKSTEHGTALTSSSFELPIRLHSDLKRTQSEIPSNRNSEVSETQTIESKAAGGELSETLATDSQINVKSENLPYLNYTDTFEVPDRAPSLVEFCFGSFAISVGKEVLDLFHGKYSGLFGV